jgi:hypothetical protein
MAKQTERCIYCERGSHEVPLIPFRYKGNDSWICSQHLPILIHQPTTLGDKLPDSHKLEPADET